MAVVHRLPPFLQTIPRIPPTEREAADFPDFADRIGFEKGDPITCGVSFDRGGG